MKLQSSWFKRSFLSALAMGLLAAACSEEGSSERLLGPGGDQASSLSIDEDRYKIAQGQPIDRAEYNSRIIGSDGGFVYVDAHYLYVPRGAVKSPTLFEVRVRADGQIGASLDATSVDGNGAVSADKNNVGRAGFRKPVYIAFYYGYATNYGGNARNIRVLWIRPDGTKVPQPTSVDESSKVATGVVSHFSDYGLGWP